jgi:hypothetical protein
MEVTDRLGYGLIDCFVEPNDLLHPGPIKRAGVDSKPQNASPQRAILRQQLIYTETTLGS